MGGKGNPLGIMQEIEIWSYEQVVYGQLKICPGEWDSHNSLGFWDMNRPSNLRQTIKHRDSQQKKSCWIVDFAGLEEHSKKRDKYRDLVWELKKLCGMKVMGDTNCNWCTWNNLQRTDEGSRRLKNKRISRDHPDYSITKISQNTESSPVDLRRLLSLKVKRNHQLILVRKTL